MSMKKCDKRIFLIIGACSLILIFASGCVGYVIGGSNLGLMGYPSFDHYRPSRPFSDNSYELDNYRIEVESFRNEATNYIENGKNDIERIEEAVNGAIDEVNDVVREYNDFASYGY